MSVVSTPEPQNDRASRAPDIALGLAALILLASIGFGVWLVVGAPEQAESSSFSDLTSQAEMSAYGGDAYTGIQNAAAETEAAVVAGANALAELQQEQFDAREASSHDAWRHTWIGLAGLIIVIASANFVITLQRSRRRA